MDVGQGKRWKDDDGDGDAVTIGDDVLDPGKESLHSRVNAGIVSIGAPPAAAHNSYQDKFAWQREDRPVDGVFAVEEKIFRLEIFEKENISFSVNWSRGEDRKIAFFWAVQTRNILLEILRTPLFLLFCSSVLFLERKHLKLFVCKSLARSK